MSVVATRVRFETYIATTWRRGQGPAFRPIRRHARRARLKKRSIAAAMSSRLWQAARGSSK
jgi:hypothetical protein